MELFNHLQKLGREFVLTLEQLRPYMDTPRGPKEPPADLDRKLKKLLYSDKWPASIDKARACGADSDYDKMERAHAILDQCVDRLASGLRVLDFGCGQGHVAYAASLEGASIAVGYDPERQGWPQFPATGNLVLTQDKNILDDYAPFDVIIIHDVLDHAELPLEILLEAKELLSRHGRIYVRCHPSSSPHGDHNYSKLDRAYSHLLLPENSRRGVIRPLEEYQELFKQVGLLIVHERPVRAPVPQFFRLPVLATMLRDIYNGDDDYEKHLEIETVDYTLSKDL